MKVTNLLGLASFGILTLVALSACSQTDGSQYSTYLECLNSEIKQGADRNIAQTFCASLGLETTDEERKAANLTDERNCRANPYLNWCAPYVDSARRVEELSNSRCNFKNKTYNFKKMREAGYSDQEIITYLEKECAEFRNNQDATGQ